MLHRYIFWEHLCFVCSSRFACSFNSLKMHEKWQSFLWHFITSHMKHRTKFSPSRNGANTYDRSVEVICILKPNRLFYWKSIAVKICIISNLPPLSCPFVSGEVPKLIKYSAYRDAEIYSFELYSSTSSLYHQIPIKSLLNCLMSAPPSPPSPPPILPNDQLVV